MSVLKGELEGKSAREIYSLLQSLPQNKWNSVLLKVDKSTRGVLRGLIVDAQRTLEHTDYTNKNTLPSFKKNDIDNTISNNNQSNNCSYPDIIPVISRLLTSIGNVKYSSTTISMVVSWFDYWLDSLLHNSTTYSIHVVATIDEYLLSLSLRRNALHRLKALVKRAEGDPHLSNAAVFANKCINTTPDIQSVSPTDGASSSLSPPTISLLCEVVDAVDQSFESIEDSDISQLQLFVCKRRSRDERQILNMSESACACVLFLLIDRIYTHTHTHIQINVLNLNLTQRIAT
eukprot:GHVR01133211.1.p1 GENE.GHVR01133211.1~~GHVR01133211.1.p1  ORF type:complete len:289 (+),score=57.80 GHVR01133211.1:22-888(+)